MNSSGPSNARMRTAPVPTPGSTCASEPAPGDEVVLAREAQGLVVVGLEEQARVVHLEDVDLAEMTVERLRVGNRVQAVEGVGEVDEAALLANRCQRVSEREPAWDLLAEEQADHFALPVGLHLLAGDHDQVAAARLLDRLERAAEDIVVGDRDRAEPLRLRVVEQLVDLDRAVVRPGGVHVEVGDDPGAVGERTVIAPRAAPTGAEAPCRACRARGRPPRSRGRRRVPRRPSGRAAARPRRAARSRRPRARAARGHRAAQRQQCRSPLPRAGASPSRWAPARRSPPARTARHARRRVGRSGRGRGRAGRAESPGAPTAASSAGERAPSPAARAASGARHGRRAARRSGARPRSARASRRDGRDRGRRRAR